MIPDETVHVEEDAILSLEIHDLHAALSQLDPVSYGLIHSYYLAEDHKTESQIAEELGVSQSAVHNPTISQTRVLLETLEAAPEFLDTFDEELFREIVDKIIVESNERLRFRLINGLELTENIERTVR